MVNFGVIKSQVSQMLGEHYLNNQHDSAEQVYRAYMRTVRASPLLMLEYVVFRNLERRDILRETACQYIDRNLALFKGFTRQQILRENQKLAAFSQRTALPLGEKVLYERIQDLILESAHPGGTHPSLNVNKIHDCLSYLLENVSSACACPAKKDAPAADDDDEATDEDLLEGFKMEHAFKVARHQCYQQLTEAEQELARTLFEGSDAEQLALFERVKAQALTYLREQVEDGEDKTRALRQVEAMQGTDPATREQDILDLHELAH